jgi:hypothetical protein
MWKAEEAFKRELDSVSLKDVLLDAAEHISPERKIKSQQWLQEALAE